MGRPTSTTSAPLCRRHHSLVHEGGWELEIGPGGRVVAVSPRGRRHDGSQVLTDEAVSAESMVAQLESMGFDFDDPERIDQIGGRWRNERVGKWAREELEWAHADGRRRAGLPGAGIGGAGAVSPPMRT